MVIAATADQANRVALSITGTVQGVGFRPYIYHLATRLSLTGWVMNDGNGVYIEIQGKNTQDFIYQLPLATPVLAKIKTINCEKKTILPYESEFIIKSSIVKDVNTYVGADASICNECIDDLFNIKSRYFHYPFISCTQCGPRYSITKQLPFDRHNTSMAIFAMCNLCQAEYVDSANRRYHAQTIACPSCGPQLSHSIDEIARAIKQGKIIALKSLGGYQLLCDAHNEAAINRLREKKCRNDKPFAIMVLNEKSALKYVQANEKEKLILNSFQRPIVILTRHTNELPCSLAPHLSSLGIMLPNTPVHYLLFEQLANTKNNAKWLTEINDVALVVTSGNDGESSIIIDDKAALQKLADVADIVVSYNRDIITHVDDSVIEIVNNNLFFIRRARGYTLEPIELPYEIPNTLALGGYLKNTVCITRNKEAFLSQHIGDLNTVDNISTYHNTIQHLLRLLNIKPSCIGHDYHPDFYSTRMAESFCLPLIPVQHHHAHLAALAVQGKLTKPALGLALDGFGMGENQEQWGGELMLYNGNDYQRLGSLKPLAQPGGDIATKQPWRMAASVLFQLNKQTEIEARFSAYPAVTLIIQLLQDNRYSPVTSSAGRLFDAASALLNLCHIASFEGQAAMMLESRVTVPQVKNDGWDIENNNLCMMALFKYLLQCEQTEGANLFHGTFAAALSDWIVENAKKHEISRVLLAGGCFVNRVLLALLTNNLNRAGLTVVFPDLCIPNDAGLSLGQAWIAGNKMIGC